MLVVLEPVPPHLTVGPKLTLAPANLNRIGFEMSDSVSISRSFRLLSTCIF